MIHKKNIWPGPSPPHGIMLREGWRVVGCLIPGGKAVKSHSGRGGYTACWLHSTCHDMGFWMGCLLQRGELACSLLPMFRPPSVNDVKWLTGSLKSITGGFLGEGLFFRVSPIKLKWCFTRRLIAGQRYFSCRAIQQQQCEASVFGW